MASYAKLLRGDAQQGGKLIMAVHQSHGCLLKQWILLACAAALSGCATVVDIAERHQDANLVQEQVMNQQLLLNIVRASHRQPLHFSRIPYIKLPLVSSAPWEFTFPFGVVGAYGRNSAKSSLGGALITVEVSPQDSQEFIQGITTPVKLTQMDFYFQQGWPRQLVLYLFVEELRLLEKTLSCEAYRPEGSLIEICDPKKPPKSVEVVLHRFRNNPGNESELKEFADAIDTITKCELFVRSDPALRGPRLAEPWTSAMTGLPEAISAGLVGHDGQGMALQFAVQSRLELRKPGGESNSADCQLPEPEPVAQGSTPRTQATALRSRALETALLRAGAIESGRSIVSQSPPIEAPPASLTLADLQAMPKPGVKTQSVEIITRSPDGLVYYLGEVLRGPGRVTIARDGDPSSKATLFSAQISDAAAGLAPSQSAVWVDYWGQRYSIPWPSSRVSDASRVGAAAPTDRSMQALALVAQLLQLQNKSTAPPRTTSVRVEP